MKDFKITWTYRDEDDNYFTQISKVYSANTEDEAVELWEKDNEWDNSINGVEDIVEIIDHYLMSQHITIDMPDCNVYSIPVEYIIRDKATSLWCERKPLSYNECPDLTPIIINEVIPEFEKDVSLIGKWACGNIEWKEIKRHAFCFEKRVKYSVMEQAWEEGKFNPFMMCVTDL